MALKHGFAIGWAHKAVLTAQTQAIVLAEPSVQTQLVACKTSGKIGEHMLARHHCTIQGLVARQAQTQHARMCPRQVFGPMQILHIINMAQAITMFRQNGQRLLKYLHQHIPIGYRPLLRRFALFAQHTGKQQAHHDDGAAYPMVGF